MGNRTLTFLKSVFSNKSGTSVARILRVKKSIFGVNLIAYIRADMGLGEAARGYAGALGAVGIPYGIINYEKGNPAKMSNLSFRHMETTSPRYDINLLQVTANSTPGVVKNLGNKYFKDKYTIGCWVWELPEFPDKWLQAFGLVDEIWVPSAFVNRAISAKSPVPVITIPYVINVERMSVPALPLFRASFKIPENTFVFLTMFDINSVVERKNPLGPVTAFRNAFASDDKDVLLIIKITGNNTLILKELQESIDGYENILVINQCMNRDEIISLLSIADCLVSLHRSEGFGLGPAEAMALGKVAMLTNWSGNTDYMTTGNCIPIAFQLKQLGQNYGPYEAHQYWADPDLNQASEEMKNLVRHPEIGKNIGDHAKQTIATHFSAQKIGALMKQRLSLVEKKINGGTQKRNPN